MRVVAFRTEPFFGAGRRAEGDGTTIISLKPVVRKAAHTVSVESRAACRRVANPLVVERVVACEEGVGLDVIANELPGIAHVFVPENK